MIYVELRFPVTGATLLRDHNHALFTAISRLIPEARGADWIAVDSVPCRLHCFSRIFIHSQAKLIVRVPQSRVPLMLKLSGRRISVGGARMRLGAPNIFLMKPSADLYARCVTIKNCYRPALFLDHIARRLDEMGIKGELELGPRRRFSIGKRMIVGFALKIHDLSEEGSIALQERGLGRGRHIGCGFFVPIRKRFMKVQTDHVYVE